MVLVYITIYVMIGWFIISIMNFALDGSSAEFDDPMMFFLILGWPITVTASVIFFAGVGVYHLAKLIGMAIYNKWN